MEAFFALLALAGLEIVLGIDNIVILAILTDRLPRHRQGPMRRAGLALAMIQRCLMLLGISWIVQLTTPLFAIASHPVSGRDLLLAGGGLFLIAKSTLEIHACTVAEAGGQKLRPRAPASTAGVLAQILAFDAIFSLDSVLTAVGMTDRLGIMIAAVIIAVGVMMIYADPVSNFVLRHPTVKMLALSFLLLIGLVLVADGCGEHLDRGYIYFAMGFAVIVELLNSRVRRAAANEARRR